MSDDLVLRRAKARIEELEYELEQEKLAKSTEKKAADALIARTETANKSLQERLDVALKENELLSAEVASSRKEVIAARSKATDELAGLQQTIAALRAQNDAMVAELSVHHGKQDQGNVTMVLNDYLIAAKKSMEESEQKARAGGPSLSNDDISLFIRNTNEEKNKNKILEDKYTLLETKSEQQRMEIEKLKATCEDLLTQLDEEKENSAQLLQQKQTLQHSQLNGGDSSVPKTERIMKLKGSAPCTTCVTLRMELDSLKKKHADEMEHAAARVDDNDELISLREQLQVKSVELREKEKYATRLKEETQKALLEYKEVCKSAFGFSLAKHKGSEAEIPASLRGTMYEVRSVSAVDPADKLLIHAASGGKQISLLTSPYLAALRDTATLFFSPPCQSLSPPLPAFLALITLWHFSRLAPGLPPSHPAVLASNGNNSNEAENEEEEVVMESLVKSVSAADAGKRRVLAPLNAK